MKAKPPASEWPVGRDQDDATRIKLSLPHPQTTLSSPAVQGRPTTSRGTADID
jgi:hypothetical protein